MGARAANMAAFVLDPDSRGICGDVMNTNEAFDLIAHAEVLEERLGAAAVELAKREATVTESLWLASAAKRIGQARKHVGDLHARCLRLPEMHSLRVEHARSLQGAVMDAFDSLLASITKELGERSPLIEAIYRNIKTPQMRRCAPADFEKFCVEIEKRLGTSYVSRLLADPEYAAIEPALAAYRAAVETWRTSFSAEPATEAECAELRGEVESIAQAIDTAMRQARLLTEAARVTAGDLFDSASILEKPKRRGSKKPEATTGDLFARTS